MMTSSLLGRSLGDLACSMPGAIAVFQRHGLDFSCRGRQTLAAALDPPGLDTERIVGELAALDRQPDAVMRDWRDASAADLIDWIQVRFHARHREQFPELIRLARRVEAAHAGRPECPRGLAEHLLAMQAGLEGHMAHEERTVFPLLAQGKRPVDPAQVEAMRVDHDGQVDALARMVELVHGLEHPRGALLTGLRMLRDDLMEHIHLENNILFEGRAPGRAET